MLFAVLATEAITGRWRKKNIRTAKVARTSFDHVAEIANKFADWSVRQLFISKSIIVDRLSLNCFTATLSCFVVPLTLLQNRKWLLFLHF